MKKIGLFCVVLALILSAVSPACAAGTDGGQTVITALCELPEISVVVPATAEGFINPYEMPVTIESGESTAQIISTPACIENQSEVPLRIGVTVTAKVWEGSSLFLSGTSTGGTGTLKRAFVYFEMQASDTAVPPDSIWASSHEGGPPWHSTFSNGCSGQGTRRKPSRWRTCSTCSRTATSGSWPFSPAST